MAHTITPIRAEARTTMMAVVHRHIRLPAATAPARSESDPSLNVNSGLVGRRAYGFCIGNGVDSNTSYEQEGTGAIIWTFTTFRKMEQRLVSVLVRDDTL